MAFIKIAYCWCKTLYQQLRQEQLGQAAASLALSTLIALVPMFTVILAVVSFFPMFEHLESWLGRWFIQSVVPDMIAKPVLKHLRFFSTKASSLGGMGAFLFTLSALSMMMTIEKTINAIFKVPRQRPWLKRMGIFVLGLVLGPLLWVLSLAASTAFFDGASRIVFWGSSLALSWVLHVLEWCVVLLTLTFLYKWGPYTAVKWKHASGAAVLTLLILQACKKIVALYILKVPSLSVVYGAFAVVPVLLIWIWLAWLIVLLGAVVTAHLPFLNKIKKTIKVQS